jgi:hypothetical protein
MPTLLFNVIPAFAEAMLAPTVPNRAGWRRIWQDGLAGGCGSRQAWPA